LGITHYTTRGLHGSAILGPSRLCLSTYQAQAKDTVALEGEMQKKTEKLQKAHPSP